MVFQLAGIRDTRVFGTGRRLRQIHDHGQDRPSFCFRPGSEEPGAVEPPRCRRRPGRLPARCQKRQGGQKKGNAPESHNRKKLANNKVSCVSYKRL